MSTALLDELERNSSTDPVSVVAAGFPPPLMEGESDCFARQEGVPGHRQDVLRDARIVLVGAGGLGSWAGLALARSGATSLTIIDPDRFDRTNASRQLMFGSDVGEFKAVSVTANLASHMIAGGMITGIPLPFHEVESQFALATDVIVCLVDNNDARFNVVRFARKNQIPAVFGMLSGDSMRLHVFLQTPSQACLWCALPNLAVASAAPCASVTINSCLVTAALASFLVHRALMGWPGSTSVWNFHEMDFLAETPDRSSFVQRRADCEVCGNRER
jgi:molybdopterin/thiamine biosynthesis adenylyltransferase